MKHNVKTKVVCTTEQLAGHFEVQEDYRLEDELYRSFWTES